MLEWLTPQLVVAFLGTGGFASLIGLWATRLKSGSDEKAATIAARGPEWSSFAEQQRAERQEQRAWLESRIADQDKRIGEMKADLRETKADLKETRADLRETDKMVERLRDMYRAALDVIRRYVRLHPGTDVEMPEEIRDDLHL